MPDIDGETLHALIGEVYDAALDPQKWTPFLAHWGATYGAGGAIYTQDTGGASPTRVIASANIDPAFQRPYEAYYSKKKPYFAKLVGVQTGQVLSTADLCGEERTWMTSEYYNDYLAPLDLCYGFLGAVRRDNNLLTAVSLIRPCRFGRFTDEELLFVRQLMPHLEHAVQMHQHLVGTDMRQRALLRGLDGLNVGVVLVAGGGRILFANRIAEDVLANSDALRVRRQCLLAASPALTKALMRHIAEAARTGAGDGQGVGGTLLLRGSVGDQVSLLICPFPIETAGVFGPSVPAALILLRGIEERTLFRESDLIRLYDLSPAESKLVVALLAGKSIGDFAQARGISLMTAKTQLRQVFEKTGQNRQSDLIRYLLSNPILRLAATQTPDGPGRCGGVRSS